MTILQKKTLIIDLLKSLHKKRDYADGLLALMQRDVFGDEEIDRMYLLFQKAWVKGSGRLEVLKELEALSPSLYPI